MSYHSEYYLTYTAEDARMDKADGLPPVQFPQAPVQPAAPRKDIYQVGYAQRPSTDDPRVDREDLALRVALALATGDQVAAVWRWDGENPETLYLVYQSNVFRP